MVAKKVAGVAGSAAGSAAGGFFNNPGAIAAVGIVTAIVAGLIIFRNDIRGFFGGLEFPEVNINIPNPFENFQLPTFELPTFELPTFEDIFGVPSPEIGGDDTIVLEPTQPGGGGGVAIGDELDVVVTPFVPPPTELEPTQPGGGGGGVSIEDELEVIFTPFVPPAEQEGAIIVGEESALGGGPSFEGGTTTFGNLDEIVDSLSEVLQIFPSLTASQARDALEEFSGLTFGEFALINPDVVNISGGA